MISYTIKAGDTLYKIALRFGVTINAIMAVNPGITAPNMIMVGSVINIPITIPAGPIIYTLQSRDTLYGISVRFGTSIQELLNANPTVNPYNLIPGTNISIPLPDKSNGAIKIYNILGSSTSVSQQQAVSLSRWRDNTIKLANNNPEHVIINGPIIERSVCLTFDDGPDTVVTPKVLDILKKHNAKASFFFTGHNVSKHGEVALRAYQDGHSILSHSYYHPNFLNETSDYILKELSMTEDKFYQVIGRKPAFVRPPFGAFDERVLEVFKSANAKAVIWSIDSMDWSQNISKDEIVRNVLNNIRLGDIVLMHSYSTLNVILEALPVIILGLMNRGYKLVNLGEMLNTEVYR